MVFGERKKLLNTRSGWFFGSFCHYWPLATTLFLMVSVNLALIPIIAYGGARYPDYALQKKDFAYGFHFSLFLLHTGFTLGPIDGCVRKGRASRDRSRNIQGECIRGM